MPRRPFALAAAPVLLALACGGSQAREPTAAGPDDQVSGTLPGPPPGPDVTPALEPMQWLVGDWQRDGARGSEHWLANAGALFGVGFTERGFEVMIIDDAPGPGPADGKLRFYAFPGGDQGTEFALASAAPQSATFSNPDHDFPTAITYGRDGDRLTAVLDGKGQSSEPYAFNRFVAAAAPELERADEAFAAATAARGIEGWVAAFDPEGAMWGAKRGRIVGADAIRAAMTDTLAATDVQWHPVASRSSPVGDLGFTIGRSSYLDRATGALEGRGAYVTIWRRQPDGSWKVLFDTGRIENR